MKLSNMLNFSKNTNKLKEVTTIFDSKERKISVYSNLIYFLFAGLFVAWVLWTYRNIVHMDMLYIVSTKVKHLYENNLQATDFIYNSLFPMVISIGFTFLNSLFFHLNTVIETSLGCVFLVILGFKYLNELSKFISSNSNKLKFALLISFIIFGLHKWELTFTSFGSFSFFFSLCIYIFSYFFLVKYVDYDYSCNKKRYAAFFLLSNFLVVIELSSYFYAYILSVIILLYIIKQFKIVQINKRNWNIVFVSSIFLFLSTVTLTVYLSNHPSFKAFSANQSISGFITNFFQRPGWFIEFYLIANSGPFLGEAFNYIDLRAFFGLVILISYALAIYYVVKHKDKRLLVPVGLIFYNIISYGFVTMGRYTFNVLEYGSSSRYTAFTLSGVVGLTTIVFFYILEEKKKYNKSAALLFLAVIIAGYTYVDIRQLRISPYRVILFSQIKNALLTGENLEILQADRTVSLNAIEVLRKYNLNVYYGKTDKSRSEPIDINKVGSFSLIVGEPSYENIEKFGFYENEDGFAWTNGNSSIIFDNSVKVENNLTMIMTTYMPPVCKNVHPKISLTDSENNIFEPVSTDRKEDAFIYQFYFKNAVSIRKVNINSETIDAFPDQRTLSFPFKGLIIRK